MRIISGKNRGKQIVLPKFLNVRPTTDFAKESLFNVLNNNFYLPECSALDLFSGTGSISYEFASRGCTRVVAVELSKKQIQFIIRTSLNLDMPTVKCVNADVFKYLKATSEKFDIIFADPPYDLKNYEKIPELVLDNNLLNDDGRLIVEHSANTNLNALPGFIEQRKYGHVNFSFFTK